MTLTTPVNFGACQSYAANHSYINTKPAVKAVGSWWTIPMFGQQQNVQAAKAHNGSTKSWLA